MSSHGLAFSCECSQVSGEVVVEKNLPGNHIRCYCKDCQNFQGLLKNPFNKLDSNGGTEIYQTYPALYKIQSGAENIRCFKFGEKGIYRWYTSCCHSHLANTLPNASVAVVGVPVNIFKMSSEDLNSKIGKISLKTFAKYAKPNKPQDAYDTLPKTYLFRILPFLFRGIFKKLAVPHPLFQPNGEAISKPETEIEQKATAYSKAVP